MTAKYKILNVTPAVTKPKDPTKTPKAYTKVDLEGVEKSVGFWEPYPFPFKAGDEIIANVKKNDLGYYNGYDPALSKGCAADPLEGASVNGVVAPAQRQVLITSGAKPEIIIDYMPKIDGVLTQLQGLNEKLEKILTQLFVMGDKGAP